MADETPRVSDILIVELVDCAPPVDAPTLAPTTPEAASPVQRAMEATLESTGADPPPAVTRG
jgi:hypothetical protein